jgi:hypothetical protein
LNNKELPPSNQQIAGGPPFAQPICQFVTGSKRCGKEVKIRAQKKKSSGQLNRGNQRRVWKTYRQKVDICVK